MTASDFQAKYRTSQSELLIENIERLHTTQMGAERIKRNLKLDTDDVVGYCKELILNQNCRINDVLGLDAVIARFAAQGLSPKETADRMGIPLDYVVSSLNGLK